MVFHRGVVSDGVNEHSLRSGELVVEFLTNSLGDEVVLRVDRAVFFVEVEFRYVEARAKVFLTVVGNRLDGHKAEVLTEKLNTFTRIVESEGYHVSVGYEIQSAGSIQMSALIKAAENKMYQAKQEFYSQNPAIRRRHPRCAPDPQKSLSPQ